MDLSIVTNLVWLIEMSKLRISWLVRTITSKSLILDFQHQFKAEMDQAHWKLFLVRQIIWLQNFSSICLTQEKRSMFLHQPLSYSFSYLATILLVWHINLTHCTHAWLSTDQTSSGRTTKKEKVKVHILKNSKTSLKTWFNPALKTDFQ